MSTVDVRPFEDGTGAGSDAEEIARLSTVVRWPSLADPEVVRRVCTAPGSTAYVARCGERLVGWAQALGDGVLASHLSFLAVHPEHRGRGIARLLVVAVFCDTGTARMDLVVDAAHGAEGFYERFAHRRLSGFRLYPGA